MLKNAYSSSALPNIFSAIEKTLSTHGAKQIVRDYDGQGRITAIAFVIETAKGAIMVKLPARFDRVETIFQEQGYKYKPEQPYQTAWATIRDWVDDQMAILDWEMVKIEEIFLPYMVTKTGQTFFEMAENNGFLLGAGENKNENSKITSVEVVAREDTPENTAGGQTRSVPCARRSP